MAVRGPRDRWVPRLAEHVAGHVCTTPDAQGAWRHPGRGTSCSAPSAVGGSAHYDQTLRQGAYIFWVGLLCLVAGFVIIGIALRQVVDPPAGLDNDDKQIIAIVGLTGGVLADFIGVIFLRMYSQAIGSMSRFHERLVNTHHLHFGNFLAARISDKNTPDQNRTLEQMALAIANSQGPLDQGPQHAIALVPVPTVAGENGARDDAGDTPAGG
jgi:Cyanobacterial TRADD-N associated 2-Transmembrane domain